MNEPRKFDFNKDGEIERWFCEMRGYFKAGKFLQQGTDVVGRKFALEGFEELQQKLKDQEKYIEDLQKRIVVFCSHCKKITTLWNTIDECSYGGMGMCMCDWSCDDRVYHPYEDVKKSDIVRLFELRSKIKECESIQRGSNQTMIELQSKIRELTKIADRRVEVTAQAIKAKTMIEKDLEWRKELLRKVHKIFDDLDKKILVDGNPRKPAKIYLADYDEIKKRHLADVSADTKIEDELTIRMNPEFKKRMEGIIRFDERSKINKKIEKVIDDIKEHHRLCDQLTKPPFCEFNHKTLFIVLGMIEQKLQELLDGSEKDGNSTAGVGDNADSSTHRPSEKPSGKQEMKDEEIVEKAHMVVSKRMVIEHPKIHMQQFEQEKCEYEKEVDKEVISLARQSEREKIIEELKKEKKWLENARLRPAKNQIDKALSDIDKFILKLEQQLKPDEEEVKE